MKEEEIKEQAIKLYEAFYYKMPSVLTNKKQHETAKECAALCVDMILEEIMPIGARTGEETIKELALKSVKRAIKQI